VKVSVLATQKHNSESLCVYQNNTLRGKLVSVEKVNKIKEKASIWVRGQSTEKLESIKKKTGKIMGNNFEEISQIEWTLSAIDNELSRRMHEEVLKAREEILAIFQTNAPEKEDVNPQRADRNVSEKSKPE
jgi:hypothetical protein